jgi:Sec-independent protein translocase protein TatA
MPSNRTKMKMAELYRKLYLAIESLRKYILSGVDIEEQFTSKNSDERTIAALIADVKKVVNDVKEDVRQSVKKVANKAGAHETNEHTQLVHMVRRLEKTVSDMHNDLSTLKGYRHSLSLSLLLFLSLSLSHYIYSSVSISFPLAASLSLDPAD